MKVSNLIADVEYIVPKGTIDKYKYGVEAPHIGAVDGGEVIHQNPSIIEQDMSKLRTELNKSTSNSMKLQQVDIVGKA